MIHSHKAAIIICTRPESSRLPNKVFKKIAGRSSIEHLMNRLSGWIDPLIVAIPTDCRKSDIYEELAEGWKKRFPKFHLYEGDPESPLHRMKESLRDIEINPKWIVRITHDDILIDLSTIFEMLDKIDSMPGVGYAISPGIVDGAGVEIFRSENLYYAAETRNEPTEFISYFVKSHPFPEIYKYDCRQSIRRKYRLTMDYEEDAVVLDLILKQLGPDAGLDKIVHFIDRHPYILNINRLPDVTLYTCAYNAETHIEETVSSVAYAMDYNGISCEYIFIDDASTDNTLLKASKHSNDRRFKYFINDRNSGLATSCNKALVKAKGSYIMRIDADDWIMPESISLMKQEIEKTGAGAVYSSYKETDETGNVISDGVVPWLNHHAGCAMMDKRLLNEIRFKDGLRHWDSLDIYQRLSEKVLIAYLQQPLWYYRIHKNSLSHSDEFANERKNIKTQLEK